MCSTCGTDSKRYPDKAFLFTQNTTRNPISWNPALRQPNPNEVLHAVHLSLHHALDPCVTNSGEPCSWTLDQDDTLVIPCPEQLKYHSFAPVDKPEISVKLRLYGPHDGVDRREHIDDALRKLKQATGFSDTDRFVIGFDAIRWQGGDAECKSGDHEIDNLVKLGIWEHVATKPELKKIGVSDFSCHHLQRLFSQLPASTNGETCIRKPAIDQLNFDKELPEVLVSFAQNEKLELLSHSDNRVPWEGIEVLLNEFRERLPLPPSFEKLRTDGRPAIDLYWVMKYTIVLKDRGLLADKGFIVSLKFNNE